MRTTLTLEDHIAQQLKARAFESGKSFKQVVNETLRRGLLDDGIGEQPPAYRLEPVSLGAPGPGIDPVKALALADALETKEIVAKLARRK